MSRLSLWTTTAALDMSGLLFGEISVEADDGRVLLHERDTESILQVIGSDHDDWIELHNTGADPIDLGGKYLTDDAAVPRKWRFPDGTQIDAGSYLLIWADEDESAREGLHAGFRLSAAGEEVLLLDTDERNNAVLDSVTFGSQTTDRSFGRPSSNPTAFETMFPTPGRANR